MPVFTFTADAATDQLTVVGHGLLNGDGPVAVRNLGGALPGALTPVTDYWAILVDADHIKLATSNPNALAGTAINLTSAGTGTQLLEVGIPYRIAHSYVERAVVRSADLTAIQAALQAMHGLFTGQAQNVWNGISLAGPLASNSSIVFSGVITASISGATNVAFAPSGISDAAVIRLSSTGAPPVSLGGIVGGAPGRMLTLINVGTVDVLIVHENGGTNAADRISLPTAANITIRQGGSLILWYDATSSRWRPIGGML